MPSSLPDEVCSVLAGAAPPASENDDMNDVAAVVPAEAACLVEAGILFLAQPVCDGTLSWDTVLGRSCRTYHHGCSWFGRCWNAVSGRD